MELHATCTVGEFNRNQGIVKATANNGSSPPLVAVTMIEVIGPSANLSTNPVEVVLDHGTTLCVSPVASTWPEPKSEIQTWRERKDARPKCRCPASLSACPCQDVDVEYVTRSRVVHSNQFYMRVTDEKILKSAPLAPFLNVMVFDFIKIKDLHEDTMIQVVGYNIEISNKYLTTWAYA